MPPRKTRFQFSHTEELPDAWASWTARDRRGFMFTSPKTAGGLYFSDQRPRQMQTWRLAGAERFPASPTLEQFKKQLRAYFVLWGGREGPNIPEARRRARR